MAVAMAEQPLSGPDRPGLTITRVLGAPPERVWREWTEPEAFADWFGGAEVEVPLESVAMDVRPGGAWRATMLAGRREIRWIGEYLEVDPPARLVLTITDRPAEDARELLTVGLRDLGDGRTEMVVHQEGHMRPEDYEGAKSGWGVFLDRLGERLAGA
jgi:uncharacterized protein YndB with AHSA1/START domain